MCRNWQGVSFARYLIKELGVIDLFGLFGSSVSLLVSEIGSADSHELWEANLNVVPYSLV